MTITKINDDGVKEEINIFSVGSKANFTATRIYEGYYLIRQGEVTCLPNLRYDKDLPHCGRGK